MRQVWKVKENSTPLSKDLKERVRFHLELWLGRNNTAYLIEKAGEFRRGSNHNEFVPSLLSTSAYMYVPWSQNMLMHLNQFSHSVMPNSLWLHGLQHARLPCPSSISSQCLLKLMAIELVMPSNHLILCRPLLLLPSIFPSIKVFSHESVFPIRWLKY